MKRILKNVLFIAIFALIGIFIMNSLYKKTGYGYFKKTLSIAGITHFTRDNKVKCSSMNSYKIENSEYNNAAFYKNVKLKKNTPYRVSCMIKTENVDVLDETYKNSGAKISILDSEEESECVVGTSDWKKVELSFNSKQNDELKIAFMLGGNSNNGNVKGSAWFSDMQLEEGSVEEDNKWNFACFILKDTDVTISENRYQYQMSEDDVKQINNCMERFQNTLSDMSDGKIEVAYQVFDLNETVDKLSYDENNGYYIDPSDISNVIDKYTEGKKFDHIFVCTRLNDEYTSIPVKDWIGLGSMEYGDVGFSNIRMPSSKSSNIYVYDENSNVFPEEVFVHEFLHSLEKNAVKYGFNVPALHSNENYGYKKQASIGLYNWYKDYMNSNISDEKLGLDTQIYKLKPIKDENFCKYKIADDFEDVTNIIERIKLVAKQ
ncbi:MAG: hypothetical protein IKE01_02820 [Clostridia bacterium]|nr:hypothetical protein [Clostridia bacterium]